MDIETLNIYLDCMRNSSFKAVARKRDIDPATVTRAIASLETELSIRLFHRTTRRIEATEAGLAYFERIEPLVEELRKAALQAADSQNSPQGLLRISSPVSFAEMNITPLLPEFADRYPGIRFDYILTDADLDLLTNHIDLAIRVGPLTDSRLIAFKLAEMKTRVVATPGYLKQFGKPKNPRELLNHNCLCLSYRGFDKARWTFQSRGNQKTTTVTINERLASSNAMALKQCTLAGMGVALLATWMISEELKSGALIDLFPKLKISSAYKGAAAWALYPSRDYLPNKTRLFVDFLKEKFSGRTRDQ